MTLDTKDRPVRSRRPGWELPWRRRDGHREPAPTPPSTAVPMSAKRRVGREARAIRPAMYPRRWRRRASFLAGLAVCVLLLVLFAYVAGHGAKDIGLGGFAEGILTAATAKGSSPLVAFLLVAVAAWCIQRLWLERLAWRPGQVLIPVFTPGSELTGKVEPLHLTTQFRQRFAALRVQSLAPVPGTAPEAGFLEVVGQKSADGGKPLSALLAVAQAAKPTHAYVVHGVLVERSHQPKYGVTIQVVRVPGEGAPPETVWEVSWDRAIRRAADRAMAHILPRTRRCDAPWASWGGYVMPPELLETYEAAVSFEEQRRYDQALARYLDAVTRDPMNLALRLHVGHLQEKLGLYIDALATYQGMLEVGGKAKRRLPKRVYRKAARRERDRVLTLAQYRLLVLIGGPPLAEQWRSTSRREEWSERDEQRADVRDRLRGPLTDALARATGNTHEDVAALLAEPDRPYDTDDPRDPDPTLNKLRLAFVQYALGQLPDLRTRLTTRLGRQRADAPRALTPASLELTRLCLEVRQRWIKQQCESPRRWIWTRADVATLESEVDAAAGGSRMLRWHEHYNAACAFALPLLVRRDRTAPEDDQREEDAVRDRLATLAVDALREATTCADSGYIATRRDWLLTEDPDLDGLRVHTRFKAFEAMFFPGPVPTPRRPRHVQRLEVSRYTRDLIEATATRWQAEWHARRTRNEGLDDPHGLTEWWEDEARAWALVGRTAWNHRRWRVRFELLEAMDELSIRYDGSPLDVAFHTFEEPWMCRPSEIDVDRLARRALDCATDQLHVLAGALSADDPVKGRFAVAGIEQWIDRLRDREAAGKWANVEDVRRLCDRHAAVWERLHLWVATCDPVEAVRAGRCFRTHLGKLSQQLRDAE
jgi:hypothetical protein